jgi:lysophospholipid acyltransferase (LPLAT)-like uncharacterized protein
MKIRNRRLLRWIGRAAAVFVRLWLGSTRVRDHFEDPAYSPFSGEPNKGLYAAWHETILITAWRYGPSHSTVLISKSADGELITGAAQGLGWKVIRGSSNKGASNKGAGGAVRETLDLFRQDGPVRVAFTPDGPKGPRRKIKMGLLYVAAKTGAPILPAGVACERPWRAKSWDRLIMPRPFRAIQICVARPVFIPPDADDAALELFRQFVEEEMARMEAAAERMVPGGAQENARHLRTAA